MGRGNFQTLPHLSSDVARLVSDLEKETDRGVALLGAAFIDDVLEVMLRASFLDDDEAVSKLLGPGRPLESFGARSHVAYCLGLLGEDIYADINLLREIRNDFAHRHPTSFEQAQIKVKCGRLACIKVVLADDGCTCRERFIGDVVLIANHLIVVTEKVRHAEVPMSFAANGVLRVK